MGPSESAVEAFLDGLLVDIADFGYNTGRLQIDLQVDRYTA